MYTVYNIPKKLTSIMVTNIRPIPICTLFILWLFSPSLFGQEQVPVSGENVYFPDTKKISTYAEVSGELRQWHKVTLTIDGPKASQFGQTLLVVDEDKSHLDVRPNGGPPGRLSFMHPNPFLDYRMTVTFRHETGEPVYVVPGYFAADGNAAETGAISGDKWRAHLSPDKTGKWDWEISFVAGVDVSINSAKKGLPYEPYDGLKGSFDVGPSDKEHPDFRSRGRLTYVGHHYLQFKGNGEYFLKAGTDAPETLLAYADFDGTMTMHVPGNRGWIGPDDGHGLHEYAPHLKDWQQGDPTWRGNKGRGLIGALNYLSQEGLNAVSFMTYTGGGDGENVWPWVSRNEKLHFDVSKLAQWEIVFEHAQKKGLFLNFKFQEQENDSGWPNRAGLSPKSWIPEAMDGGALGKERKLYTRELIARFGHHLALNWNLGEETQMKPERIQEWSWYIRELDPYDHHMVIHTLGSSVGHENTYPYLLGDQSAITGPSMQTQRYRDAHAFTLRWIRASQKAGKPWAVSYDEQGNGWWGVPADPGFEEWDKELGFDALDFGSMDIGGTGEIADIHGIRKYEMWPHFMAGGFGIELYFGYKPVHNDLDAEDFRSRAMSWGFARKILEFFRNNNIPFWEMENHNPLIGNKEDDNSKYCFAKPGEVYLIFLPEGGSTSLDLRQIPGNFEIRWYDPRNGGGLQKGTIENISGGAEVGLGTAPSLSEEDWLLVVSKK
ncbi:DUF5060 domain-containing protein [Pleomorphovibrio marinus]|uniref:DUF5060 domain-containing protein n=1 Tax=Pleomorphovibrio marinus TaxID=2164132 RepID=UPI000E0BA98E|nr:DUF5060 domain-containing protein [Pleomorphovibrio marinus]